jgi:Kef-type K+ transport system membrane component KefB
MPALTPLALAIIQICVIIAATRVMAAVLRRFGQPAVVGELVAGILLGPSLLGWVAPDISATLFPKDSFGFLSILSQLGLLLFMFLVGLELDPREFNREPLRKIAVITSHVSIAVPFVLGALIAIPLYGEFAGAKSSPLTFALFLGTAMSITAFPVLARILRERELTGTRLGQLATACAAIDDVTAWCMLAAVVVVVQSSQAGASLWITVGGTVVFGSFMLLVVRQWLSRLADAQRRAGRMTNELLTITLLIMFASALITELIGIHALFGAFLAGAIMPKMPAFMHALNERLEDVTVVLLVPIYFAFTGLRTSIGLFATEPVLWAVCIGIILVAVAGKYVGATFAASRTGIPLREASALGVLMNTRGLVELVVLNVGLDVGVLSPLLFAMMVVMALTTTFMTTPLLNLIYPKGTEQRLPTLGPSPATTS